MKLIFLLLACSSKSTEPVIPSSDTQTQDTTTQDTSIADSGDTNTTETGTTDTSTTDTAQQSDTADSGNSNIVMASDFTLPDINPVSLSLGQDYSPRDYLQKVSGWYFIKGT